MSKPPKPYAKDGYTVGMKVQDGSANVGTVRAIVKFEKKDKPPNSDTGTYIGVEFEEPNGSLLRGNGTWEGNGQQYFEAPVGSVEFIKANEKKLWPTLNEEAVKALRLQYGEQVKEMSDTLLIKFCVARKFEMPKVQLMLENHLKWVADFKPTCDAFLDPKFGEFYPVGFVDGYDREGNILYFERPGNAGLYHPSKFVATFGIEKICQWHITSMEEGRRRLKNHPTAKRVTAIIDLTKLGDCDMSVVKFGKAIGAIDQNNYPEHLSKMFIINAPGLFTGVWRIMRAFIDDRTKQKISILGKDYKSVLDLHIENKFLPDFIPGGEDVTWRARGGCVGSADPQAVVEAGAVEVKTPRESEYAASPERAADMEDDSDKEEEGKSEDEKKEEVGAEKKADE